MLPFEKDTCRYCAKRQVIKCAILMHPCADPGCQHDPGVHHAEKRRDWCKELCRPPCTAIGPRRLRVRWGAWEEGGGKCFRAGEGDMEGAQQGSMRWGWDMALVPDPSLILGQPAAVQGCLDLSHQKSEVQIQVDTLMMIVRYSG